MGNENRGDVDKLVQAGSVGQVHFHEHHHGAEVLRAEQLPPPPAGFVDREPERARLDEALERGGERALCVTISGGSGTGKTALALHWLHGVRDRFPDGQVYVDLRGKSVSTGGVLSHCLRGLGMRGADIPSSEDEALAEYRSRTSGRKVAFVFDDVAQPRELLPLLPASDAGLMVLITHRQSRDLVVDGVLPLELRRLDVDAGIDLLRAGAGERVAAEADAARRLVELCGGLPIALRITAGRLAKRPRWTVARVVAELDDDRQRLDRFTEGGVPVVSEALDRAVGELPEAQESLYRLLGVIPGPAFAADAVAALAQLPVADAEELLYELHEANLLECNDQDEFRFHDLVRLHATRLRTPDAEALRRLVDWYRVRGAYADRAVLEPQRLRVGQDDELLTAENPFDHDAALRWLEQERVNLLAVLDAAHRQEWNRAVISLCDGPLWALHNQHKHYSDTLAALGSGVEAARREQDRVAEARLRTLRVQLLLELREFTDADEAAAGARAIAEESGHRRVLGSALEFHGKVHLEQRAWSEAISLFEQARAINVELGKPRAVALQEYLIGRALTGRGDAAEAVRWLTSASERLREFPRDRRTPGRINVALGRAHQQLGDHEAAIVALRTAVDGVRARTASFDLAEPLELLAESLLGTGDADGARRCLREALDVLDDARNTGAQRVRDRLAEIE
ncbi:NB-ARC domain-containing protein [Saccharopolyspora sp. NFXS83]|uniref:NB-ARC domain-containing protein n=1 Tax=Saccharopolyspora sp. NFXS83 TaxID=2993560 RepID=UPI00224B19D1|nr:NB-ARC domain-containing protein [Saccharopolyspora sp. NFXS83]MCX2732013.1 NB-ARC domain-containing protein [Saccharopolyspora sp. NFXS83]